MPSANLYQLNRSRDTQTPIYVYLKIEGFKKEFPINSGYKMHPKHWDVKRQRCKNNNLVNTRLNDIKDELIGIASDKELIDQDFNTTLSIIRNRFKNKQKPKNISYGIESTHKKFVIALEEKGLTSQVINAHKKTLEFLALFGIKKLAQFNNLFYGKFRVWMKKRGYSDNYFGKQIKNLKQFLYWCEDEGIKISGIFKRYEVVNEFSEDEVIALSSKELKRIWNLDFTDPEVHFRIIELSEILYGVKQDKGQIIKRIDAIKRARDQAVAIASCGCHKEDFWRLSEKNIKGGSKKYIKYFRGKNERPCIVPYFDDRDFHFVELFEKNSHKFRRMTSINTYLKYLPYLTDISKSLTAKVFRKTFASIWYFERNAQLWQVMKMLGHAKEETTKRYLAIDDDDMIMSLERKAVY